MMKLNWQSKELRRVPWFFFTFFNYTGFNLASLLLLPKYKIPIIKKFCRTVVKRNRHGSLWLR